MTTRILFHGQEYASPEDMPAEVRQAYEALLAKLPDADQGGAPDRFQRGQPFLGIQKTSIVVNGQRFESLGEVPAPLRGLVQNAIRSVAGDQGRPMPPPNEPFLRQLDSVRRKLGLLLQLLALFVAGAVIVVGSSMIVHMDASSRTQGGRVYVGLGMLIVLAWAVGLFVQGWRRRS